MCPTQEPAFKAKESKKKIMIFALFPYLGVHCCSLLALYPLPGHYLSDLHISGSYDRATSAVMHVVFLTVPASGQANVQLATAQSLVDEGHQVTFLSGQSLADRIMKLKMRQTEKRRDAINLISLGSNRAVEDL